MGLSSRQKGQRGERKLASVLREGLPDLAEHIRRGWQARLGCDDSDVCGIPGFWIEHKCGKKPNPRRALKQAKNDAKGRAFPIAIIQDDHARERVVVLELGTFLRVLRAAFGMTPPLTHAVQLELEDAATISDEKAAE